MKKILLMFCLLVFSESFSQEKRVPSIVVLSAQELTYDKELDSIVASYKNMRKLTEEQKKRIRESNGENFTLKSEKEILFLEEMDLGSQVSFGLNFYLSFKLFEYHENNMVYPAHEKNSSTKTDLKKIADKHDMNWIVNIPTINFTLKDGIKKAKVRFQLYNQKFDAIVLDNTFTVEDQNPGFTFACEPGTINCVINNTTSAISHQILQFLNEKRKYWR